MIKELIKIANELDSRGFLKEADALDQIIIEAQNKSQILPLMAAGDIKFPKEVSTGPWRLSTSGAEAEATIDVLSKHVFRSGYDATKLLDALGTEPWTITFNIEKGKVAVHADPETNQKVVEAGKKVAAIIENKKNPWTKDPVMSATYRTSKKRKGTSGESMSDYETIVVERPPAKVVVSTIRK